MQPKQSPQPPDRPRWRQDQLVVSEKAIDEVRRVLAEGGVDASLDRDVRAGRYRLLRLKLGENPHIDNHYVR
jgi:hypothetical protein